VTDGTRSYQAGNLGDSAIVQQGEHLSLIVNYYQSVAPQVVDQEMLSAASQQLARLPLETLPGITSLPSGSRMPFAPNSSFVGRASNLRMLAASFKDHEDKDDTHVSIVAVTGLGGIGKTQLATEFVHRYGQYFVGGVFWLSFAEASAIPLEVAECGRPGYLNLRSDFHTLSLDDQIRLVLGAWQSSLPRLLVFDNCEEEELLVRWRPPTGASHVLMTSHRAEWDATLRVKVLPLGELQQADSVRLLRSYAPGLQASDADFAAIIGGPK